MGQTKLARAKEWPFGPAPLGSFDAARRQTAMPLSATCSGQVVTGHSMHPSSRCTQMQNTRKPPMHCNVGVKAPDYISWQAVALARFAPLQSRSDSMLKSTILAGALAGAPACALSAAPRTGLCSKTSRTLPSVICVPSFTPCFCACLSDWPPWCTTASTDCYRRASVRPADMRCRLRQSSLLVRKCHATQKL